MSIKYTLFVLCLFVCLSGLAQKNAEYGQRYLTIHDPTPVAYFPVDYTKAKDYLKELGIQSVAIQSFDVKNGKEKKTRFYRKYHFDADGRIMLLEGFKKGRKSFANLYTQDVDGYLSSVTSMDKDGNISGSQFYSRVKGSRAKEYVVLNKKGDTSFYSSTSPIVDFKSNDYYYKKGKLKNQWYSEYYPNKQLKKTVLYNGKGKEKYVWDYSCKEEGIEVLKHKDTSTVCKSKTANANGDTLFITEKINEKGEIIKTIYKQNKFGKYFYSKRTKGVDEVPEYEWFRSFANDTIAETYVYTKFKKGKKSSYSEYGYDQFGNRTSQYYTLYKKGSKDKTNKVLHEYDENNRPVLRIMKNEKDGIIYKTVFNYD